MSRVWFLRVLPVLLAWLIPSRGLSAAEEGTAATTTEPRPKSEIPPALKAQAEWVERYERFREVTTEWKWHEVYKEDFAPPAPGVAGGARSWELLPSPGVVKAGPGKITAELQEQDGRGVLVVDCEGAEARGVVAVGPHVRGDFAVEVVGRITSQRVCDLSLFAGSLRTGPGFGFGAKDNTCNTMWGGPYKHAEDGLLWPVQV